MSVKVPPMSIPSEWWASLLLELQVLERRGIREPGNEAGARLLDPRPHAPDERQVVDGNVDDLLLNALLDLVDQRLALLRVELPALAHEEVVDVGEAAVG